MNHVRGQTTDPAPTDDGAARNALVDVSVVIPTYNERVNIEKLSPLVAAELDEYDYEIIVVDDDSPDQTWRAVRQMAQSDRRVNVIRRTDERGLSSAVLAGLHASRGDTLIVMDADLQHDETILPQLVAEVRGGADIAVGSRGVAGGGYGEWSHSRRVASWTATQLAQRLLRTPVSDPMSGYFAISRDCFDQVGPEVNPRGFKILLEFLSRSPSSEVVEVGYVFRNREAGETKLTGTVALDYVLALVDLRFGWVISTLFVRYALIGILGIVVNFSVFLMMIGLGLEAVPAVVLGVQASIIWNFFGNNWFTFAPHNYTGSRLARGLLVFQLVSLHAILVQASVFSFIRFQEAFESWPERPLILVSNLIAIAVATVGNYFLHRTYTWGRLGLSSPWVKRDVQA